MPFVLELKPGSELLVEGLTSDQEHLDSVVIGFDSVSGAVYKAVVVLMRQPYLPPGNMELQFGITEALPDGSDPRWINSGLATKGFLRGEDRAIVLNAICTAAVSAATELKPDAITFTTAETHLPAKALTKYGLICKALRTVGYHGGRGDSYHGSEIWMLKRRKTNA